jgi:hypothetical protein
VNAANPSPEQAQAALAEAAARAAGVRRADRPLRNLLFAVAGTWLAAAAVISLFPRGGSLVADVSIAAIMLAGIGGIVFIGTRVKALSRWALGWFAVSIIGFCVWSGLVDGVSLWSGFWASRQGSHFLITVSVDVIPLVIAGWLVGRRR